MSLLQTSWKFSIHLVDRIMETRVLDAAAAIAYYAMFSLFPFILFIVAFNASFLNSPEIQQQIMGFTADYMPGSEGIVEANIHNLIHASGAVSLMGTVVLLWSATLVFASFACNINLAWLNAEERHFLIDRLIGLMMIGVLVIVLISSLIVTTTTKLIPKLFPWIPAPVYDDMSRIQQFLFDYLPILTIFGLFIVLYRYVPNAKVRWRESIAGSIFATTALLLTKTGFVWYLSVGTGSYSLIYGSLGAVVAFMLWLYISSCVILIGGHVSATVAFFLRPLDVISESLERFNSGSMNTVATRPSLSSAKFYGNILKDKADADIRDVAP